MLMLDHLFMQCVCTALDSLPQYLLFRYLLNLILYSRGVNFDEFGSTSSNANMPNVIYITFCTSSIEAKQFLWSGFFKFLNSKYYILL